MFGDLRQASMHARVLAAVVLASGCGSDDDDGATSSTAANGSATPNLVGSYARRLTGADIKRTDRLREEGPDQGKPEPGPLTLTLSEGTLRMTDARAQVTILQDFSATSDGAFRIGAYQRPEQGSFCGPDVSQTASYAWRLEGDVLRLTAKNDACADRDSILSGAWKHQPDEGGAP